MKKTLIIPTYEERQENKAERAEIMDAIMNIQNTKMLHGIAMMARSAANKELKLHPMALDEFVDLLDLEMVAALRNLFKDESPKYIVNAQMQELLERAWDGVQENKTA